MATHSSVLAWRIPWTEELGGLQSTGRKELDTTERLHFTSEDMTRLAVQEKDLRMRPLSFPRSTFSRSYW